MSKTDQLIDLGLENIKLISCIKVNSEITLESMELNAKTIIEIQKLEKALEEIKHIANSNDPCSSQKILSVIFQVENF